MDTQNYCLKWEGFQSNVTALFNDLRQEDELVDITLCSEGEKIGAHRMMLSACSPYFRDVLKNNPCPHMVFYMKDTSASNLRALVEFMYKGSVNVSQSQLASFIKTAESLQIRGLSGEDDKAPPPISPPPAPLLPPPPPLPPVQRRPSAAAMVLDPPAHRRSAPASQEHRLPPPPLPVPSPPAKRRRHVSSEFMAAVPISASAPSVISTPSDTEQNNVTSAPSAVGSSDAAASPWDASAPEPTSPTSGASNQSAITTGFALQLTSSRRHLSENEADSCSHRLADIKPTTIKIEKFDLADNVDAELALEPETELGELRPGNTLPSSDDQYASCSWNINTNPGVGQRVGWSGAHSWTDQPMSRWWPASRPPVDPRQQVQRRLYTCKKCGQSISQDTGHRRYSGHVFCPSFPENGLSCTEWLQQVRSRLMAPGQLAGGGFGPAQYRVRVPGPTMFSPGSTSHGRPPQPNSADVLRASYIRSASSSSSDPAAVDQS